MDKLAAAVKAAIARKIDTTLLPAPENLAEVKIIITSELPGGNGSTCTIKITKEDIEGRMHCEDIHGGNAG